MPSERAAVLADDFVAANDAVVAFARTCTDAQWRTVVPGEGWTVGVVLHYIAEGHAQGARWMRSMVAGDGVADTDDDIDARNVTHATAWADVGVAETVALLEEHGRQTERLIRRLSDQDLDRTSPLGPAGGRALPVAKLASVSSRHALGHLAHAREAVASAP